ncbi:mechanosensitive ion channel family protein [Martelella alba]|uniref:Mechanosensitive ion channel family protein n=1 Tax=Martelella alba TaxID=2590451 RepID=A0A506UA75_9HYPH|nr:mechanosensitive ion channel family protein [Martelella alba]TPW30780.1 mechanosensitive ion channel family protein [Martelella alba]
MPATISSIWPGNLLLAVLAFMIWLLPCPPIHAEDLLVAQAATAETDAKTEAALKIDDHSPLYRQMIGNPISPPDTSSPRATLESFLLIMHEANSEWIAVRNHFFDSKEFFLSGAERSKLTQVRALLDKASETLDLSQIPATARDRAGVETVLQLQEILDRIYLPSLEDVPGESPDAEANASESDSASLPERWKIPGTDLVIAKQTTGEDVGKYLFTTDTVGRIGDDYNLVRALPVQADHGEDLYDYYVYTPGNLVAPKWYDYILKGPKWLQNKSHGQAVWQWIGLVALCGLFVMTIVLYTRWRRMRAIPLNQSLRQLRHVVQPALVIIAANLFRYLCEEQINITGPLLQFTTTATSAIVWASCAWLTYQMLQLFYLWAVRSQAITRTSLDASLVRTGFRVLSFGVAILIAGYGATRIGIPIYGVVAGLGVGGLAIALAAQPTIENLIGGVILYTDGLVRVGEFVSFADVSGTIEEIGIRSTRIRALDRTLITIANSDLAKTKIINYSQRDVFLFRHAIGLRYETSNAALTAICEKIKAMLEEHKDVRPDPLRVRVVGYGDFSINIDVFTTVLASDMNAFLAIQEELLLSIRTIAEENGSGFAFPSSTLYLTRDDGVGEEPDFTKDVATETEAEAPPKATS